MTLSRVGSVFSRYGHLFVYAGLALTVMGPLLAPGYLFALDMVFPPQPGLPDAFYGFETPLRGGFVALYLPLHYLAKLVPAWVLQKLVLAGALFTAGVAAHSLVPGRSPLPRYFAGVLFMVNPFVLARLLAGHWVLLVAYAFLPLAVREFAAVLRQPTVGRGLRAALLTGLVSLSSHMAVLALLVYAALIVVEVVRKRGGLVLKGAGLTLAWFLPLNAFWLLPVALAPSPALSAIGEGQLPFFTARVAQFNAFFSVATMYGFWRGGWLYPADFSPLFYLPFVGLLYLAVLGGLAGRRRALAMALMAAGVVAVVLGTGVSGPTAGMFEWLFRHFPFFKGFRDSQKFVALVVLAYAYLGGLGVAELLKSGVRRRWLPGLVLALPIVYSFTLLGTWGQMRPVDYPAEWYQARRIVAADPQDSGVLFLPWHLYMDFSWVPNRDQRVGWMATGFFPRPVLHSLRLRLPGVAEGAGSPAHAFVEDLLARQDDPTHLGRELAPLNIKYVALAREAYAGDYDFLYRQADLELVVEGPTLALFRNRVPVSRAYPADGNGAVSIQRRDSLRYRVEGGAPRLAFVPPNWQGEGWRLGGQPPLAVSGSPVDVFPAGGGDILFRPFFTRHLPGYFISVLALLMAGGYGLRRLRGGPGAGRCPQPGQGRPPDTPGGCGG